ncbi:MAG: sulfotransferase domain-containing protein [Sphingomonas sp.]
MPGLNWLISYPRSGSTWSRVALWSLANDGASADKIEVFGRIAADRALLDDMLDCDSGSLNHEELEALRPALHRALAEAEAWPLIKVHDAWRRTVSGEPVHDPALTRAAIYVVRDPRDVALSWAHFMGRSVDWAIDFMNDPGARVSGGTRGINAQIPQYLDTWSTHVASWADAGMPLLMVRYEDMLAEPEAAYRRMAEHLGLTVDDAIVARAVEASRFGRLAEKERAHGFTPRPATTDRFFHSGQAGRWRDMLQPAQVRRIEADHGAVMRRFGYL